MTAPENGAPRRGATAPDLAVHEADDHSDLASGAIRSGVVSIRPETITKRRDFLAAARARKAGVPGLLLQGRARRTGETPASDAIRVGYTCSKKVGDAVRRNRAKRRLRAAAATVLPARGRPGWDYVLIGKAGATAARDFKELLADLEKALSRVHAPGGRR